MRTIRSFLATVSLVLASGVGWASHCPAAPASDEEAADQSVDLRPRFVQGRTARYSFWGQRNRNLTMSLGETSKTVSVHRVAEGEVTWRVEDVADDGSATCVMTLDWITVKVTAPDGQEIFNDSREADGDNETVQKQMEAMVGAPVRVTVAADGSVTGVTGVDAIRQQAPEGAAPEDLDFMETASELATIPFAPAELAVGEGFNAQFEWLQDIGISPATATMAHDGAYTLVSVEELAGVPVANVEGKTSLSMEVDLSKAPANAQSMEIRLVSGQVTSQVMFDLWRHETVGRNTVQTTQIEMVVPIGDRTLTRTIDETAQSQTLRIAEE